MKDKFDLWCEFHNPYYYWWKVRKYFKRPKFHFLYAGKLTWIFGLPILTDYYNPYFDIILKGVGWKSKYDSPRHEWDPMFAITILRKWQIIFTWNYYPKKVFKQNKNDAGTISMATWEAILDMVVFNKSLEEVYKEQRWVSGSKTLTIIDNIRNKWKRILV